MIYPLQAGLSEPAEVLGGKGRGLVELLRLGLPVPPGFVIGTAACRDFLRDGRLPDLEAAADLLPVSVRSGAAAPMPGMMTTVLDVAGVAEVREAVRTVFSSWHSARATTYRTLHGIPHDLGTAVVVQSMVYGDRDDRSGTGVAFSRDPSTGSPTPYGEMLVRARGDAVVGGGSVTRPLSDLEPAIRAALEEALERLERHYRDVCHVEFTFESGRLWFLQVRSGGLAGAAAVRAAVDLADEGLIDRRTAVGRISPRDLSLARTPRIRSSASSIARGVGAGPGVATGRVAVTADGAVRMAADGPVVLVRPHTSPLDLHGMAAAAGILTSRGGPASHAAVVARSMGKPAVVGAAGITVEEAAGVVRAGDRVVAEGTLITIDGTGGEVVLGDPGTTTAAAGDHLRRLLEWSAAS